MKNLKWILAFTMGLVLLTGVFKVDAYAISGTDYYTYGNDYKTNDLSLDDNIYYYQCDSMPYGHNAYVHYIVNGVDVGYSTGVVWDSDDGLYAPLFYPDTSSPVITNSTLFDSTSADPYGWHFLSDNAGANFPTEDYHLYIYWGTAPTNVAPASGAQNVHVHNYKYQTIKAPTIEADGLEGELCSCGAMKNTQPISAMAYALNTYANSLINAAKPGQTVTFEFGEWNSFPKSFMQKLVEKNGQNVTFVFHYKWNHVKQEIKIPAGTPVDLNFDWYGPAKMAELYGMN